jgi:ribosome biogenesis GTPase A
MTIQWYPGHMAKTKRIIKADLALVDVVIELLDARIPKSSRNPEIDNIIGDKKRLIVLNKRDLADRDIINKWITYFKNNNIAAIAVDSSKGTGLDPILNVCRELLKEKLDRLKQRGLVNRPVRAMVLGIPNVGKSSFINRISGKNSAKAEDRPGVTRGKQWIRIRKDFELLDTPGILWPKFDDEEVAFNLAFTGAIKDNILDIEELTLKLLERISQVKPQALMERYKLSDLKGESHEILHMIGKNRGCIISGGEVDTLRTSQIIIDEFRGGKLGPITLELP